MRPVTRASPAAEPAGAPSTTFRELTAAREEEFVGKGHRRRHFFPHRVFHLPKCGPDGHKLATWMCGEQDPGRMWELVLYAAEPVVSQFPPELFFDDDLIWHRQQFGRRGQVATTNLVVRGRQLYTSVHISDLVQRISRRPEYRSRIENRFKGWSHLLLNAIMGFALERGIKRVHTPTAALAITHTDPARAVGPELFERVYDRTVEDLFPARRDGGWWTIDVARARDRVVVPEVVTEPLPPRRRVCVTHDIERGFGHTSADPAFAVTAHQTSPRSLDQMLTIEADLGCRATYNVMGTLYEELRPAIEAGGHCLAFHSYDHPVEPGPVAEASFGTAPRRGLLAPRRRRQLRPTDSPQLDRCRELDYRAKGYRPAQSRRTPELNAASLCFHNFEWLASSDWSFGASRPWMADGIVWLPIHIDDWALYTGELAYERWEQRVIDTIEEHEVGVVCLHDCYGPLWLSRYRRLLQRLSELGTLTTMDEAAGELTLRHAA